MLWSSCPREDSPGTPRTEDHVPGERTCSTHNSVCGTSGASLRQSGSKFLPSQAAPHPNALNISSATVISVNLLKSIK